MIFLSGRSFCLEISFKPYFQIFLHLITFLFDFSYFPDFLSFCIHTHAAGLRTESVLVSSFLYLIVGVGAAARQESRLLLIKCGWKMDIENGKCTLYFPPTSISNW